MPINPIYLLYEESNSLLNQKVKENTNYMSHSVLPFIYEYRKLYEFNHNFMNRFDILTPRRNYNYILTEKQKHVVLMNGTCLNHRNIFNSKLDLEQETSNFNDPFRTNNTRNVSKEHNYRKKYYELDHNMSNTFIYMKQTENSQNKHYIGNHINNLQEIQKIDHVQIDKNKKVNQFIYEKKKRNEIENKYKHSESNTLLPLNNIYQSTYSNNKIKNGNKLLLSQVGEETENSLKDDHSKITPFNNRNDDIINNKKDIKLKNKRLIKRSKTESSENNNRLLSGIPIIEKETKIEKNYEKKDLFYPKNVNDKIIEANNDTSFLQDKSLSQSEIELLKINTLKNSKNDLLDNLILLKMNKYIKQSSIRKCSIVECNRYVRSKGLCKGHGGGKRCQINNCGLSDQGGGFCISHGGGKRCKIKNCMNSVQSKNLCKLHGGGSTCKIENCKRSSQSRGFCTIHGESKICLIDGCLKKHRRKGLCMIHSIHLKCKNINCHKTAKINGFCMKHIHYDFS